MKCRIKKTFITVIVLLCVLVSCIVVQATGDKRETVYQQISQEEAKEMMANDGDQIIIVDVRTQEEYDNGHIPGAICIPNESIEAEKPEKLPDLEQSILVYCRSGRRSKEAAQKLMDIGYVNVYEFGGILDWTGDIVTDEEEAQAAPTPTSTVAPKPTATPKSTATPEPKLPSAEKKKLRKKDPYNPKYYGTPEEYADFIADDGAMYDEEDGDWGDDLYYDDLWDDAYEEWEKANK